MMQNENGKANSTFAFAYQMRCCCDWIWTNLMNKTGDGNHAKFLVISREFSKMATGKLTGEQKDLIESKINALRE
jgi:hypothetical protein